jgi:hypothetical protein
MVIILVPVVIWDQTPRRVSSEVIAATEVALRADREFSFSLENALPKDSMVFQLPLMPFPESSPINAMADYEHFRPYLHTTFLRYSYGTNKGRVDSAWQDQVASLPPRELVNSLENAGFGAVIINRKGYQDGGKKLIHGFLEAGKSVIADSPDMIAFVLQPAIHPVLPLGVLMSKGWSHDEPEQRWAVAMVAEVDIQNSTLQGRKSDIRFGLKGLHSQNITISVNDVILEKVALTGGADPFPVHLALDLVPGLTRVKIATDVKPARPDNGDMRMLSFAISGFVIK